MTYADVQPVTRVIAATYLGRVKGYRFLVRAPNFEHNHALRVRMYVEHCISIALSELADAPAAAREQRVRGYVNADAYLTGCCPTDPL